jgi:hypothetical protein
MRSPRSDDRTDRDAATAAIPRSRKYRRRAALGLLERIVRARGQSVRREPTPDESVRVEQNRGHALFPFRQFVIAQRFEKFVRRRRQFAFQPPNR